MDFRHPLISQQAKDPVKEDPFQLEGDLIAVDVHDLSGEVKLSLRFFGLEVASLDLVLQVQHDVVRVLLPKALSGWNLYQAYQLTDHIVAITA